MAITVRDDEDPKYLFQITDSELETLLGALHWRLKDARENLKQAQAEAPAHNWTEADFGVDELTGLINKFGGEYNQAGGT